MLDDTIVLKNCYYWAKRLICKGVDFNELVSIGYLVGKPLRDKRLLKDWIYYSMIKFIIEDRKSRCSNEKLNNNVIGESSALNLDEATNYADLYQSIKSAKLTLKERTVIELFFFRNKTQPEIALAMGVKQQTVHYQIKHAIIKIRELYLKGIKE